MAKTSLHTHTAVLTRRTALARISCTCTVYKQQWMLTCVLVRLLVTDASLALAVYYGIHTAHQYRLEGPGKWSDARSSILGIRQRLRAPFHCV